MSTCAKCGCDNPAGAKFCSNCGSSLQERIFVEKPFESLALLHFCGGAYLIIALITNPLVRGSLLFLVPYIIIGALGLLLGWQFYRARPTGGWTKVLSAAVVILGFAITVAIYVLGLRLLGLIGPAWLIFAFNAWMLARHWHRI